MNKNEFVKGYLEKLVDDKDIRKYFDDLNTNNEKELFRGHLKHSLESSYDTYAKEYFDSKGLGSYLSTFLRLTGSAADAVGTYMFWALGGAGFGVKGVGLAEKSVADVIDGHHYAKHAKDLGDKIKGGALAASEGLVERAAAYLPLGVGEISDLMRGRSKFDNKVTSAALKYAKSNFIDYIKSIEDKEKEKQPKIIKLDKFRDPNYTTLENKFANAA